MNRGARSEEGGGRREERGAKSRLAIPLLSSLFALLVAPAVADACSVCYIGESDSPMAQGMNNAIWVLLSIVGFVQVGFVALFWSFWRRARALRKRREQFHLVQGALR